MNHQYSGSFFSFDKYYASLIFDLWSLYSLIMKAISFKISGEAARSAKRLSLGFANKHLDIQNFKKIRLSQDKDRNLRGNSANNISKSALKPRTNSVYSSQKQERHSLLIQAKQYFRNKNYKMCIKCLQNIKSKGLQQQFLLGLSYMSINNNQQAQLSFLSIIRTQPDFKTAIYRKANQFNRAIQILKRGISATDSSQLTVFLFKLLISQGMIDRAIIFASDRLLSKYNQQLHILLINVMGALLMIKQGVQYSRPIINVKAILLLKLEYHQLALKWIETLPQSKLSEQVNFCRAICYFHMEKYQQSLVYLQTVLYQSKNLQIAQECMHRLLEIYFRLKDFYSAAFVVERVASLGLDKDSWTIVALAYQQLQKRSYQKALINFLRVQSSLTVFPEYIQKQIKNSLAYLLLAVGKPGQALFYSQSQFYHRLAMALTMALGGQFQKSKQKLLQIGEQFKSNQVYFYCALINVKQIFKNGQNFAEQSIDIVKLYCQKAKNSQMKYAAAFLNSLVAGYVRDWHSAIKSIDQAVSFNQESSFKDYFIRGIMLSKARCYKQACQQFKTSINIDDKQPLAYLYKAICLQMMDELQKAFTDILFYFKCASNTALTNQQLIKAQLTTLSFLYCNGNYQDCVSRSFKFSNQYLDCMDVQIRAQFKLGDYQTCIQMIEKYHMLAPKKYENDLLLLRSILDLKQKGFQALVGTIDSLLQKGQLILFPYQSLRLLEVCCLIYLSKFEQALRKIKEVTDFDSFYTTQSQETQQSFNKLQQKFNLSLIQLLKGQKTTALSQLTNISTNDSTILERLPQLINIFNDFVEETDQQANSQFDLFKTNSLQYYLSDFLPYKYLRLLSGQLVAIKPSLSYPILAVKSSDIQFDVGVLRNMEISQWGFRGKLPWLEQGKKCLQFTSQLKSQCDFDQSFQKKE